MELFWVANLHKTVNCRRKRPARRSAQLGSARRSARANCSCFSGSMSLSHAIVGENWGVPVAFVFQAVRRFPAPSSGKPGGPCCLCLSGSMSLSRAIVRGNWRVPVAFVFQAVRRFPAPSSGKTEGSLLPLFFRQYVAFPRHRRGKLGGPCCLCICCRKRSVRRSARADCRTKWSARWSAGLGSARRLG